MTILNGSGFRLVLSVLVSVFFRNVIPIPSRNLDNHFAGFLDDGLASETRVWRKVSGHVELVSFVVFHIGDQVRTFLDPDMAGSASAVAAAGTVKAHALVQRDVEY